MEESRKRRREAIPVQQAVESKMEGERYVGGERRKEGCEGGIDDKHSSFKVEWTLPKEICLEQQPDGPRASIWTYKANQGGSKLGGGE